MDLMGLLVRTALVAVLLILSGFAVRRSIAASNGGTIPDEGISIRNVVEVILEGLTDLAQQTMGAEWKKWFPFVGAMFFFILIANLLGLIPGFAITDNVNVAAAWALISYVLFNYVGIREHGLGKYLLKYMGPTFYVWHVGGKHIHIRPLFFIFFPLEVTLDAARMVTLTIRLIANMFADHTVVAVFLGLGPALVPAIFIGLGVIICVLQAFVFSLLTMIYINIALQEAH
jgi:F-type H+-transporting ATPase subunit a